MTITTGRADPARLRGEQSRPHESARGCLGFLSVTEPLDLVEADRFLEEGLTLGRRWRCLVVDLERCDYADSAGIRTLLQLSAALKADGGELRLVVPRKSRIWRALSLLNMLQHLTVYASLADACVMDAVSSGEPAAGLQNR